MLFFKINSVNYSIILINKINNLCKNIPCKRCLRKLKGINSRLKLVSILITTLTSHLSNNIYVMSLL